MAKKTIKTAVQPSASAAPLHSWGIFMDGFWRTAALAKDRLALDKLSKKYTWHQTWNMENVLFRQNKVVIVTNPDLQIVFASSNITAMNGYTVAEITGRSPRIFQGVATDDKARQTIRNAVKERRPFAVSLINYKKYGQPYHCNIEGFPLFNQQNQLVHFIAFETTDELQ